MIKKQNNIKIIAKVIGISSIFLTSIGINNLSLAEEVRTNSFDNRVETTINERNQLPTLITQRLPGETYWGPDRDFSIWMPGDIIVNESFQLISTNQERNAIFAIIHEDLQQAPYDVHNDLNELVNAWARQKEATIISKVYLQINGNPAGIEFIASHSNGAKSKNQIIFGGSRMYILSAITEYELGYEADKFLESFTMY